MICLTDEQFPENSARNARCRRLLGHLALQSWSLRNSSRRMSRISMRRWRQGCGVRLQRTGDHGQARVHFVTSSPTRIVAVAAGRRVRGRDNCMICKMPPGAFQRNQRRNIIDYETSYRYVTKPGVHRADIRPDLDCRFRRWMKVIMEATVTAAAAAKWARACVMPAEAAVTGIMNMPAPRRRRQYITNRKSRRMFHRG